MIPFVDLRPQYKAIQNDVLDRIQRVLDHGQYIMGPEVIELEERLAAYVGVKHCIAASSGTDTLLIALMALEIEPGDEVITTPFTFIATGEMILLAGGIPVFVDIDPLTYNIDAEQIEAHITNKTRAIIPVSLYGQCSNMDAVNAVAEKYGLAVIEDGAQSFGAEYKGKKSCGLSTIGSTSFYPSKPLGCYGDGGALFTDDDMLAKAMREIRVHGQDRRYHHPRIGLNGRLDTLQAAILLAKLERFDWEVKQRQLVANRYKSLLGSAAPEYLELPHLAPGCTSVYAQYTVSVRDRDEFCTQMRAAGIPTAIHYPTPLHLQPAFSGCEAGVGDFPVAEMAAASVVSLPMGPDLSPEIQEMIAAQTIKALKQTAPC
jgi:UDP-2-acetamido-2-deoxy-ribo-hexuluronate aminotransferase